MVRMGCVRLMQTHLQNTMTKQIKQFRTESYGLFIDLEDTEASIGVNLNTGEILFDEGIGEDRYDGMALSPASFRGLRLEPSDEQDVWQVVLQYGKEKTHTLGITQDRSAALDWMNQLTALMEKFAECKKPTPHSDKSKKTKSTTL